MSSGPEARELRRVSSDADWAAYHEIRERVLWALRGRFDTYDRNHADEYVDGNHPFLLFVDGSPSGVVRIDLRPPVAWFRLVAIREALQGRGHGRAMLELAMDFAREHGCAEIRSNVHPDAVGFYRQLRFEVLDEDIGESVAMRREL